MLTQVDRVSLRSCFNLFPLCSPRVGRASFVFISFVVCLRARCLVESRASFLCLQVHKENSPDSDSRRKLRTSVVLFFSIVSSCYISFVFKSTKETRPTRLQEKGRALFSIVSCCYISFVSIRPRSEQSKPRKGRITCSKCYSRVA